MTYINMTRINAIRNIAGTRGFIAWGREIKNVHIAGNVSALVFAAVLIVCSITVGCSSDKPKPVTSNNGIPGTQAPAPVMPTPGPVLQAANKPAPKKVVHKRPAANYTDKTYGVAFEYPRRYAIETGEAASELLTSSPVPMNFVQPGGVALAAVELPETGFINTDFSSAFFDVSVHKSLTAEQCNEFAVPAPAVSTQAASTDKEQPTSVAPASSTETAKTEVAPAQAASDQTSSKPAASTPDTSAETKPAATQSSTAPAASETSTAAAAPSQPNAEPTTDSKLEAKPEPAAAPVAQSQSEPQGSKLDSKPGSKLMLTDLELHGTEAVSGEGTRQSDSKYFHVFQNGACYEFGLNVTTNASADGMTKHVDRDKVFASLEKILATVKIDDGKSGTATPEVAAQAPKTPATPAAPDSPAQ
jgi:hypothetical protein